MFVVANVGFLASLLTNSIASEVIANPSLSGAAAAGQILLRMGGWLSGLWDGKEFIQTMFHFHSKV